MCGILFAYNNTNSEELLKNGTACLEALRHRGPDERNLLTGENWIIGQTRLAIIDIKQSKQPMESPDGRWILTFNGEIYNFKELREKLLQKWAFKTNGDTEVILAGLVTFGVEFIKQLDGMWAFVLWDKQNRSLISARDRLGKKPIYYININNSLYISSEIPALKKLYSKELNQSYSNSHHFLKYGFTPPGTTIYNEVKEVEPSTVITWTPTTPLKSFKYWMLPEARSTNHNDHIEQELNELLHSAVKKRLIADVEIGCFLSGGLDSSIIASIATEITQRPIQTFTIGFSDAGYNENNFAQTMANRINSIHHETQIKELDPSLLSTLLQRSFGQPFGDPSILPTALLCEETSKHVKVSLSGDGADEVFSGYQRYQARVLLKWYLQLPKSLRNNISKVLKLIPEPFTHHSKSLLKKAKLFIELEESKEFTTNYRAPVLTKDSILTQLGLPKQQENIKGETTDLETMMYRDMINYLPQDILTKVDRASMSYSLEVRSPFLDTKLVEFAFKNNLSDLRSQLSGKHILKKTYSQILPKDISRRRKQGFSPPIYTWFMNEIGDDMISLSEHTNSVINTTALKKLLQNHRAGKADLSFVFWNIYSYLLWSKQT